jgi:hypothetical protein
MAVRSGRRGIVLSPIALKGNVADMFSDIFRTIRAGRVSRADTLPSLFLPHAHTATKPRGTGFPLR